MKHIYSILSLLLAHYLSFGQDTVGSVAHKNQFYVQTGICYKSFLGSRYIEPKPINPSYYVKPFEKHQYDRFTKIPTIGFNAGMLFTHIFNKHWGITTGMIYFFKKDVFENNKDTVIKYGKSSSMRDIHNTLKYEYTYHNIEIPVMAQYSLKKFTFYTGCYFSLLSYKKSTYTYVINQFPLNPQWITSDKTISGLEMPLKIFPTIQASHQMQINNLKFNPYLAFYYALKKHRDCYIQFGVSFLI